MGLLLLHVVFIILSSLTYSVVHAESVLAEQDVAGHISKMDIGTIKKELENRDMECIACTSREEYVGKLLAVWGAPNVKELREKTERSHKLAKEKSDLVRLRRELRKGGILSSMTPDEFENMTPEEMQEKLGDLGKEKERLNAQETNAKVKEQRKRQQLKEKEARKAAQKDMNKGSKDKKKVKKEVKSAFKSKSKSKSKKSKSKKSKSKSKNKNKNKTKTNRGNGSTRSKREAERVRRTMADNVIEEDYYSQYYGGDEPEEEEVIERIEL